jgi:hypothetical protein
MAWLFLALALFFAWLAYSFYQEGRPIRSLSAAMGCILFVFAIFASFMLARVDADEAQPVLADARADNGLPMAFKDAPADAEPVSEDLADFYGEAEQDPDEFGVGEDPSGADS